MRQSLEFCWQRFIRLFGQVESTSAKSLALALILFAGLQIWKIAPWILVLIGGVAGGIFL
jgi:hypothetical protein